MLVPKNIQIPDYDRTAYVKTKELIEKNNLTTVCIEANCPNKYECFSKKTATFMILGDTCTRNCRYCNIKSGKPRKVDAGEPTRIAKAIKKLNLKYAVITCVTRDDLQDGGAGQFVNTIKEIRKLNPDCKIEVLISDLKGNWNSLKQIIDAKPDVLNHNIETVRELFPILRPEGNYDVSLILLKKAKEFNPNMKIKSGFMLGLGEKINQIVQTMSDLKGAGCDIVTIGQYLQPSKKHFKVKKYYSSEEFKKIEEKAKQIGINQISAGSLVRSSYNARKWYENESMAAN